VRHNKVAKVDFVACAFSILGKGRAIMKIVLACTLIISAVATLYLGQVAGASSSKVLDQILAIGTSRTN
jgi:hypothetical protein